MKTIILNTICISALCAPVVLMCADNVLCLLLSVVMFGAVTYHANNYPTPWKQLYRSFTHVMQSFFKQL